MTSTRDLWPCMKGELLLTGINLICRLYYPMLMHWNFFPHCMGVSCARSFPTMQNFFLTISRSNSTATAWVRLNHVGVVLRPPHFTPQFNFAAASTNIPFGGLFIIFRRCVGAKPKKKFECRHRCASKIFGTTFQRVFISGRRKKGFRDILK